MSDGTHLTAWVSREAKERFSAVARQEGLSDSALLKRMVELMLNSTRPVGVTAGPASQVETLRAVRFSIRLRLDDQALLRGRAAERGLTPAAYVSVLTRAHLRGLSPLPREELLAVKRAVAELGSIGRNLNQIARAAHRSDHVVPPGRDDVRTMLRICEGLRDHVKALLLANLRSWKTGHAGPDA